VSDTKNFIESYPADFKAEFIIQPVFALLQGGGSLAGTQA
jgi:hypothetical protein